MTCSPPDRARQSNVSGLEPFAIADVLCIIGTLGASLEVDNEGDGMHMVGEYQGWRRSIRIGIRLQRNARDLTVATGKRICR